MIVPPAATCCNLRHNSPDHTAIPRTRFWSEGPAPPRSRVSRKGLNPLFIPAEGDRCWRGIGRLGAGHAFLVPPFESLGRICGDIALLCLVFPHQHENGSYPKTLQCRSNQWGIFFAPVAPFAVNFKRIRNRITRRGSHALARGHPVPVTRANGALSLPCGLTLGRFGWRGHLDESITSAHCCVHLLSDHSLMVTHNGPDVRTQYNQRNIAPCKGLLIHDVLVGSDYNLKPGRFCCLQKFTVADTCPSAVVDRFHLVIVQKIADTVRHVLIKQDAQGIGAFPRRSAALL
jgi:hypothetical protein